MSNCSICLCPFIEKTKLFIKNNNNSDYIKSCKHIFCFNCIKRWVEIGKHNNNKCPVCRRQFERIIYDDKKNKIKSLKVKNKKLKEDDDNELILEQVPSEERNNQEQSLNQYRNDSIFSLFNNFNNFDNSTSEQRLRNASLRINDIKTNSTDELIQKIRMERINLNF